MTCSTCKGQGITAGRHWLGLALMGLLEAGAISYDQKTPRTIWLAKTLREEGYPTNDLGDLTTQLCGREPDALIGHDAIDRHNAVDKIIIAAGFDPQTWGICPDCKGSGENA